MVHGAGAGAKIGHQVLGSHRLEIGRQRCEYQRLHRLGAGDRLQQPSAVLDIQNVFFGGQIIRRDRRRRAKLRAGDVDPADAGWPGGLKAQIESGKRVHLDLGARCIAGAIGHRIEIELHVGTLRLCIGAHESAELIHAQGKRSAPREKIAQAGDQLAGGGMQFIVQGGLRGLEGIDDGQVILKVSAHGAIVEQRGDSRGGKRRGRSDAGQLQKLRGIDGAGAKNHFAGRRSGMRRCCRVHNPRRRRGAGRSESC